MELDGRIATKKCSLQSWSQYKSDRIRSNLKESTRIWKQVNYKRIIDNGRIGCARNRPFSNGPERLVVGSSRRRLRDEIIAQAYRLIHRNVLCCCFPMKYWSRFSFRHRCVIHGTICRGEMHLSNLHLRVSCALFLSRDQLYEQILKISCEIWKMELLTMCRNSK